MEPLAYDTYRDDKGETAAEGHSFYTEPSYSKGSFLLPSDGSSLARVHPRLSPVIFSRPNAIHSASGQSFPSNDFWTTGPQVGRSSSLCRMMPRERRNSSSWRPNRSPCNLPSPVGPQRATAPRTINAWFSWPSDKRTPEADHLNSAEGVEGVARLVGHRQITSIAEMREGLRLDKKRTIRGGSRHAGLSSAGSSFSEYRCLAWKTLAFREARKARETTGKTGTPGRVCRKTVEIEQPGVEVEPGIPRRR